MGVSASGGDVGQTPPSSDTTRYGQRVAGVHPTGMRSCFLQVNDTDFGHMMYNASLPWEELIHPWVTVARISLTRQMPDDVMQITR